MTIAPKQNSLDTFFLFCDNGKEIEFKIQGNQLLDNEHLIGTEINFIIDKMQLSSKKIDNKEEIYKEIIAANNNIENSIKLLREQEGLTYTKIEKLLNISHNTARSIYIRK